MTNDNSQVTNTPRGGRGRKSGRRGATRTDRLKQRKAKTSSQAVWPGIESGRFKPLSQLDMEKIHRAALEILSVIGVADASRELLDIVLPKGCTLNENGRLCFPISLMEDLISGAANGYVVYARGERAGKDDIHCEGNK
ncbi:MAG: hypothetical protein GY935_25890, partial [Gammaproteobacteria bacterium]|nr:hypothetical protein [Gammaproteobacteria bacterium]